VAAEPVEVAGLHDVHDGFQLGGPEVVHTLGINDSSVGEDLEEHRE
jgi:hypothetical protein